jgi:hypothetical protein
MEQKFVRIESCRICDNKNIKPLLHLGNQTLTGVFPKSKTEVITSGPLELVKCQESEDGLTCGLVQLAHTYLKSEMYGENYGYRSGLNKFMTDHLTNKANKIKKMISLKKGDIILDIGSNDASFLKNFDKNLTLIGIDPTGIKFKEYYPDYIKLFPNFFTSDIFKKNFPNKKTKVITSLAMFYDLDSPLEFVKDVREILANDGIWVVEQSYLPSMLDTNSYDTICHEHLEYYSLKQIKWMADRAGLKIIDVEFNDINGGSFSVILAKNESSLKENKSLVKKILDKEKKQEIHTNKPIEKFKNRLIKSRENLLHFINKVKNDNKKIMGYGASTKGNVLLQFCNITEILIPFIGEVNPHKFGSFTPNTLIPIIDEKEMKKMKPDYILVLPWHLRKNIVKKEIEYLKSHGTLVFPLPKLELVSIKNLKSKQTLEKK